MLKISNFPFKSFSSILLGSLVLIFLANSTFAGEKIIRLGIIGLDTSHVPAFTGYINDPNNHTGCRVIAAYRGGSADIPDSFNRLDKFTEELKNKYQVEIVDSIEKLCDMTDGILLESVDGRVHLEQARLVFQAKKPVFIDKPLAGNLADVWEIYHLAQSYNVPCWSSSALRFSPGIIGMRKNEKVSEVIGCDAFGPCSIEPHHPDLYWYGIHGVEILFTIMGPGCKQVTRIHDADTDMVVGLWQDGRIGCYRGIRKGAAPFGAMVYGTKGVERSGPFAGYVPLVKEIIAFFQTGQVPVPMEETIEIYAFMTAADESQSAGGKPVSIAEVIQQARQKYHH